MDFYKAKLIDIKFSSRLSRWMYFRLANASDLSFLWFRVSWRRSWLPQAAYMQGWNAAFRQFYGIDVPTEDVSKGELISLIRQPEQRNDADSGIREACPEDRHTYYTAFLNYEYCPYCATRLHS